MLQALELENFKAFGKRSRIPFAPITLIFGENSAGKSSILQVLNLLKQTRESRESGALLLPRTENGIVDLGSFQEMIFNHDLERTLSIRIETDLEEIFDCESSLTKSVAIEFCFKRPSLDKEVLLDSMEIYDAKKKRRIAKFQISGKTVDPREFWMMRFYRDPLSFPTIELAASECVWVTESSSYWNPEFEWCKENKKKILDDLKKSLNELLQVSKEQRENNQNIQDRINSLNDYKSLFSSEFDLKNYISIRHREEMKTVLGLSGFLPIGIISQVRNSLFTEPFSVFDDELSPSALDVGDLAVMSGMSLDRTLNKLFPMGPFRRPPERWYIFTGTSPKDVGYRGDLLPDLLLRRPKLVKETNEWLKKLDMGYDLDVKPVGKNSGDLFEVRLIDTRRKKPINVALPDVGFGISQLLPFVVQSLVSEKQIISIEQPEVHVHPKLQADLGDLLAHAIQEPRQNRFIIETHSEHLILRLQRLVRNGDIKPNDVSVIYISRRPESAIAERLHLDEDGDFIDDWPNGFFPERLRELR